MFVYDLVGFAVGFLFAAFFGLKGDMLLLDFEILVPMLTSMSVSPVVNYCSLKLSKMAIILKVYL